MSRCNMKKRLPKSEVSVVKEASGKTSKQHHVEGKQRVNEKTPPPPPMATSFHVNIYSLHTLKHPQMTFSSVCL